MKAGGLVTNRWTENRRCPPPVIFADNRWITGGEPPDNFVVARSALFGLRQNRGALSPERVRRDPMAGDIDAPGEPDAVVTGDVVNKAFERRGAAGPAEQAAMHADRHHARALL